MLRLRFTHQGEDRVVPLSGAALKVGRGGDNDIVLPDGSVSRHHAELKREDGGWVVCDLGSTNGIKLNGSAVKRAPLHPGDQLTVGMFELAVEGAPEPPPPPAPPVPTGSASLARLAGATIIRPIAEFAATYGAAVDSKRKLLGEGEAGRVFGLMTRLAKLLITADSVEQVLERIFDLAWEALPVDRGFILLSDDRGELACELARLGDRVEHRPRRPVPVSRTMLETVMSERVALVTDDAQADERLTSGESIHIHQIRSAMCAPLWSDERIIGVVQVDSPYRVGAFDARDLDLLTALANFAAVAVERLRWARRAEVERQLRGRLERYHSPAVVEEVLQGGEVGLRRLKTAEASVLFADLVGFTPFSEAVAPEAVADLLDAYFTLSVEAIFEAGGTLDKFIGDCVMAFFGAPVPQPDHAERAVGAAIRIQRELAAWNAERAAQGLPRFAARVAVNSGPVVVGDIGSARRVDYTVLGNTVNVAARLESAAARPGDVVLGPETARLVAGRISVEPLGELQLKGLQQKITAYRVAR